MYVCGGRCVRTFLDPWSKNIKFANWAHNFLNIWARKILKTVLEISFFTLVVPTIPGIRFDIIPQTGRVIQLYLIVPWPISGHCDIRNDRDADANPEADLGQEAGHPGHFRRVPHHTESSSCCDLRWQEPWARPGPAPLRRLPVDAGGADRPGQDL